MASLVSFLALVLGSFVFVLIGIGAMILYFVKIKKSTSMEESVSDASFKRVDSTEYAKFKDIVSFSENDSKSAMGMIAVDDRTFVGGIDIFGYNFYHASADEQAQTMLNTIAFFNVVEEPVQLRQAVQPVDIAHNIEEEERCKRELEKSIDAMRTDYNHLVDLLEQNIDDEEVYDALEQRILGQMRKIKSKEWILRECEEMIYYMKYISNVASHPKKIHQLIFSYHHNPDEYEAEMTKEQIYLHAQKELETKAQIYGNAIANCGCTWKALSADDLTGLLRRHYHPNTADELRLDELMNSSYTALYISSDSLRELEIERRGELLYLQEMRAYQLEKEKRLQDAQKLFDAEKIARIEEMEAIGQEIA